MSDSGLCRLCGGPLPPRKPGAGRPRAKCDACRDLRPAPLCSRIGIRIWCVLCSGTIPTIAIRSCT
jgi:hypothetical protein